LCPDGENKKAGNFFSFTSSLKLEEQKMAEGFPGQVLMPSS
jgi:hypothetical protein